MLTRIKWDHGLDRINFIFYMLILTSDLHSLVYETINYVRLGFADQTAYQSIV
jgi:hypothetical protein